MPSVSTLFLISLPTLLLALFWQIGIPDYETIERAITEDPLFKSIFYQFIVEKHCYASIQTLSSRIEKADCFKVSDGRFRDVYLDETDEGLKALERPRIGHVIPGLWDGHGHLIQYGESLDSVNIFGSESMKVVQQRLVEYKTKHPEIGSSKQWLRGVGWDQANFEGRWPVSVRLDSSTDIMYSATFHPANGSLE
jgi:hypothetical protein